MIFISTKSNETLNKYSRLGFALTSVILNQETLNSERLHLGTKILSWLSEGCIYVSPCKPNIYAASNTTASPGNLARDRDLTLPAKRVAKEQVSYPRLTFSLKPCRFIQGHGTTYMSTQHTVIQNWHQIYGTFSGFELLKALVISYKYT